MDFEDSVARDIIEKIKDKANMAHIGMPQDKMARIFDALTRYCRTHNYAYVQQGWSVFLSSFVGVNLHTSPIHAPPPPLPLVPYPLTKRPIIGIVNPADCNPDWVSYITGLCCPFPDGSNGTYTYYYEPDNSATTRLVLELKCDCGALKLGHPLGSHAHSTWCSSRQKNSGN